MSRFDIPWLPFEIETLSVQWKLGHSASKIAEALPGRSKNAVIGQARRLGLPPRPSPLGKRKAS